MKCEACRFAPGMEEDCPFWDEYGTVWKDGREGCTVSYQHVLKLEREHDKDYWIMGTEMGLEMDFEHHGLNMEKAVEDSMHMIGLDMLKHKPYIRHGKKFFKPYRNYWAGFNPELDYMSHDAFGFVEKQEPKIAGGMPYYYLTREGLDWLGRQLKITIHDEED